MTWNPLKKTVEPVLTKEEVLKQQQDMINRLVSLRTEQALAGAQRKRADDHYDQLSESITELEVNLDIFTSDNLDLLQS